MRGRTKQECQTQKSVKTNMSYEFNTIWKFEIIPDQKIRTGYGDQSGEYNAKYQWLIFTEPGPVKPVLKMIDDRCIYSDTRKIVRYQEKKWV